MKRVSAHQEMERSCSPTRRTRSTIESTGHSSAIVCTCAVGWSRSGFRLSAVTVRITARGVPCKLMCLSHFVALASLPASSLHHRNVLPAAFYLCPGSAQVSAADGVLSCLIPGGTAVREHRYPFWSFYSTVRLSPPPCCLQHEP